MNISVTSCIDCPFVGIFSLRTRQYKCNITCIIIDEKYLEKPGDEDLTDKDLEPTVPHWCPLKTEAITVNK